MVGESRLVGERSRHPAVGTRNLPTSSGPRGCRDVPVNLVAGCGEEPPGAHMSWAGSPRAPPRPRLRASCCARRSGLACLLSPLISSCCPVPPGQSCGPMVLSPRSGKMRSPRCAGETFRCAPNPVTHSRLAREPPPEPPNLLYQGSVRDQRPRGDRGRRQRTHRSDGLDGAGHPRRCSARSA